MTIEQLVVTLSDEDPRPRKSAPVVALTLAALLALTVVLTISTIWFALWSDLSAGSVVRDRNFLFKLMFAVSIVASALPIVRDLSVPGRVTRWSAVFPALPFGVIMALALRELAGLPISAWLQHARHASWADCLWQIPALGMPAFVILLAVVRCLAPTQLIRTGAGVGLLAGGMGAVGYVLHCHDDAVAYVAISYTAAMLEMAALGAIVGPRVLRWT